MNKTCVLRLSFLLVKEITEMFLLFFTFECIFSGSSVMPKMSPMNNHRHFVCEFTVNGKAATLER